MVDQGSCTWVTVPGTDVSLQIQNGQPLAILRAFAADFNSYVEPLRDQDSACWTATNSVSTSNHLSGTAMDLNWNSHPFMVADAGFDTAKIARVRELLDFYEGMIFWGNDWSEPKDAMHFQLASLANGGDINTYGNQAVDNFIARKIRSDGYSTFRRGGAPVPPTTPELSRAERYALLILAEGRRRNITPRGIQIAFATAMVESNIKVYANERVPESMSLPHDDVGSDAYSVGIFQQQVRNTGNGWWWGDARACMDPTSSAGLFYDRLSKLTRKVGKDTVPWDYNDTNWTPGTFAQAVQQSAYPDRYDMRFDEAVDLYNKLSGLDTTIPTQGDDDLSAEAERKIDVIYQELTKKFPSRSPLRHLGEGPIETMAGFVLNADGSEHVEIVKLLASLGHPDSLALLREVAGADPVQYPDRQGDKLIAQAILADLTKAVPAPEPVALAPIPTAAQIAPAVDWSEPVVVPTAISVPETTGQIIGRAYDALEALQLSGALTDAEKAPLAALIGVLQTKTGGAS